MTSASQSTPGSSPVPSANAVTSTPLFVTGLAFVAGALNMWAFMNAGAFATSQTGNLVAAVLYLLARESRRTLFVLGSVLAFGAGAFLSAILLHRGGKNSSVPAEMVLFGEAAVIAAAGLTWATGLVPATVIGAHSIGVLIAFVAGAQGNTFHQIAGFSYGNVSITQELQALFNNLAVLLFTPPGQARQKSETALWTLRFGSVLAGFVLGALLVAGSALLGGWPPKALSGTPLASTGWSLLIPAGVTVILAMAAKKGKEAEIQERSQRS